MDELKTYHAALAYLGRRDHSQQELKQKLQRKGASAECIDYAIKRVQEDGYQDDHRFAEMYTVYRARRGFGPARILQELLQRGVAEDIIIDVLSQDDFDWAALAKVAWQKKFKGVVSQSTMAKAKQWRFLQYRGFSSEDCRFLMR